jgi:microsomal dipeptidase-like Zn-dependent dipeptidase
MKTRFDVLAAASAVALGFGLVGLADAQMPPNTQLPQVKPVPQRANPPAQPSSVANPLLVPAKPAVPLAPLLRAPLPGWADLHAHPASHLSFGADAGGNNGIFWGKPGLGLASSNPVADLPACAPDKHGGFDADVVRHKTHQTVIGTIDNITGYTHGPNGAPDFLSWPNARSLTHQQMHVSMLKRAYDGGQRLMIASVTDNEFLSSLWSKIGYNAAGNQVPLHDPNFNIQSARRQLAFIKSLVAANSTWMEIALSAAEARRIVTDNKMAIILSAEMDSLLPAQILELVQNDGVRHVIPIHLINNTMGGTAVYTDAFNTANAFVNSTRQSNSWNNLGNDAFFRVRYDTRLTGRLSRPQTLVAEGSNLVQGGAIWPRPVDDATWASLGYDRDLSEGGHRNVEGLTTAGMTLLHELALRGVLIDIAHMSEESADDALRFATANDYPVMDSHTGMRAHDETGANERALKWSQAALIAKLGGVIGLGTEGTSGMQPIINQPAIPQNSELVRFTGSLSTRAWTPARLVGNPVVSNLTVTIKTGGDDLRGGNNWAKARVTLLLGGAMHAPEFDLSSGEKWDNGTTHTKSFALPPGTHANDIRSFALVTNPNGKNGPFDSPDNWNVDQLRVDATLAGVDTIGTWINEYKEIFAAMHARGVAMGTDMNGFAPQVPFSADAVTYPLTVAQQIHTWKAGYAPPSLAQSHLGPRTYNFQRDGLANYGMLADFMQAISQKPGGSEAITGLFRSANDVVEMWEKAEARKSRPFTVVPP